MYIYSPDGNRRYFSSLCFFVFPIHVLIFARWFRDYVLHFVLSQVRVCVGVEDT